MKAQKEYLISSPTPKIIEKGCSETELEELFYHDLRDRFDFKDLLPFMMIKQDSNSSLVFY